MKLRSMRRPVIVAAASVSVFALALGGNAAADAFITGKDVKNNSLSGADIKNGSISGADVKTNTITWRDIANGTVRGTEIRNGSIALADMSDEALEELVEGILGVLEEIGVFQGLDDLNAADREIRGDVEDLEEALTALAARVTAAEGTLAEVVADAAEIDGKLTALTTRVEKLEKSALVDSNWGAILRNVIGSADAQLRNGPFATNFGLDAKPPMGSGSLELNIANGQSRTTYGNEVDWVGKKVADIGSPSFWVYTTGENMKKGPAGPDGKPTASPTNLPNISIEINPDAAGKTYATLVFVPTKAPSPGTWTKFEAGDGYWYLTGDAFKTVNGGSCGDDKQCTLAEVKAYVGANNSIYSIGIGKGRDMEFHGAVDALTIGETTYDFEARGVVVE
ncbi:MAG: hypothetical protein ACT4QG_22975 [Sporichthyaceae bacterium]